MRCAPIALCTLACFLTPAAAQLSIDFGTPGVSIGINIGGYPTLQRIPGYPVYYAPGVASNYFFYDGLYWVFDGERWYASSWYNGPWRLVDPLDVPFFLLRIPVRYYHHAPAYFRGWRADAPPRWGEHWGQSWESRRHGWDQWDRRSAPAPAPLPTYQRQYSGGSYPQAPQQAVIGSQNYRYQPSDPVAQQHFQQQRTQAQAAPREQAAPPHRTQQEVQQQRQQAPAQQRQQPSAPPPQPQVEQRQQRAPRAQPQQAEPRSQPQRAQEAPSQQPQRPPEVPTQQPPQAQKPEREPPARGPQGTPPQGKEQASKGKGEEKGRGREKDDKENK